MKATMALTTHKTGKSRMKKTDGTNTPNETSGRTCILIGQETYRIEFQK